MLQATNMATVQIFEVMSGKFNALEISNAGGNSGQNCITMVYNY